MSRIPTRMSKHGYPIYEQTWNQEVHDCIFKQGLEVAINNYTEEEVLHHLGGEAYGAEIGSDYVVLIDHFDNNKGASWSIVEPILDMFKDIKPVELVGATLTGSTLILQYKIPRLILTSVMYRVAEKAWSARGRQNIEHLKSLPLAAALAREVIPVTDNDWRGWGVTEADISELKQVAAGMGLTRKEFKHGNIIRQLVVNELSKIGIVKREVSIT